jgi:hypothetical protein
MTTSAQNRVPHLRDGLNVAKVGIVRTHDRFPFPNQQAQGAPSLTPSLRVGCTHTIRKALAFAVAVASRYPKASALGLPRRTPITGFSPWGMLSSLSPGILSLSESTK